MDLEIGRAEVQGVAVKRSRLRQPATGLYTPQSTDILQQHLPSSLMHLLDIGCNFRIFCSLPLIAASLMFGCWGGREKAAQPSSKGSARSPTAPCLRPMPLSRVVLTLATHWTYLGSFKKNTAALFLPQRVYNSKARQD